MKCRKEVVFLAYETTFLYTHVVECPCGLFVQCKCISLHQLQYCNIACLLDCVFVFSSHSFWTSSSLDVPAGVTQEEGHTGFFIHLLSAVRALIFLARRIQPFLSLVDCEVELLCANDLIVLHPLGIFILFFRFLVRKIPFAGIELTSQRVRGLRGTSELPGLPAL